MIYVVRCVQCLFRNLANWNWLLVPRAPLTSCFWDSFDFSLCVHAFLRSTLALASPCPTPMRSSSRTAADNTFTVFASVEGEEAPAAAAPEQPFPAAGSDVGRFSIGRLPGWAHDQVSRLEPAALSRQDPFLNIR